MTEKEITYMKVIYKYPGVKYSVDSILEFQTNGQSNWWSDPFFYFFPQIDKQFFKSLDIKEKKLFLLKFFNKFSKDNEELIKEKIDKYNERWNLYQAQIINALNEAFGLSLDMLFNDIEGYITFNPISPRYLENNTFDVFYLNSENGALGLSIHEIIHFVWFYVWNNHFKDDYKEYETPNLKWILSEMVVEPIMRDQRLRSIDPYFDEKATVYPYFYTLLIEEKPILDILYDMYIKMPIIEFMEKSYDFCLEHKIYIMEHIADNEK